MARTAQTSQASPSFARSTGLPLWMGKSNSPIKCLAPDVVKEDFTRLWRESGFESESAFLLDMVLVRLYGRDEVRRMRDRQLDVVTGTGTVLPPARSRA